MNKLNWSKVYGQAVPYMEAYYTNRYENAMIVFFTILVFALVGYFMSRKKSPKVAKFVGIVLSALAFLISGIIVYSTWKAEKFGNPYVVSGTVDRIAYEPTSKSSYFTMNRKEAFYFKMNGATEPFDPDKKSFYFSESSEKSAHRNPLVEGFFYIYDSLEEGKDITLVVIPKSQILGTIVNEELHIP